jgi:hypothetical protein
MTEDALRAKLAPLFANHIDRGAAALEEVLEAIGEVLEDEASAASDALDSIAVICGCPEWEYPGQVVRDVEGALTALTFAQLRDANKARVILWHPKGVKDWSGLEWAGAMCGEAGEAANVAKKLKRIEGGLKGRDSERDMAEMVHLLGMECADVLIYLDLLAYRYNIDLGAAVAEKFNRTSVMHDFPQRLPERVMDKNGNIKGVASGGELNTPSVLLQTMGLGVPERALDIDGNASVYHVVEGDTPVTVKRVRVPEALTAVSTFELKPRPTCIDCGEELTGGGFRDWLGKDGTPECHGNSPSTLHHPKG